MLNFFITLLCGHRLQICANGNIGDSDALLVEKYCGAKPFEMRSQWKQSFNLTFQFNTSGDLKLKLK